MIRSLNTGVAGMRQFQTSLDVIGNNLANINTVGFKGARAEFADTLSYTMRAPTPDTGDISGVAGKQVGNGMQVSAIKNKFTQGALKQTGVRTDLAVNGNGFFLVKDPLTKNYFATRAGDFREDTNGYLVTNDGFRVQGRNQMAPAYTDKALVGDLQLDVGKYTADRAEVVLDYATNVFELDAHGFSTGNQVKFSAGLPAIANDVNTDDKVFFVAKVDDSTFTMHDTAADAVTGMNVVNFTDDTTVALAGFSTDMANNKITLAGHGLATGDTVYLKDGTIPGGLTAGTSYFVSVAGNDLSFHTTADDADNGTNVVNLTEAGLDFKLYKDSGILSDISLTGGASLSQYSFGPDGRIKMLLTDGTQYDRGQVLLQIFKNEQSLVKTGSNRFENLSAAGAFGVEGDTPAGIEIVNAALEPGKKGAGRIVPGALELSNVDMADEFSRMIIVQRAFQANARVISTSDEILREMMALKR
jgi:flagellar hook protein FlgE